ncbi:MAG: ATP-binding protein [Thermoguttaceae bacterium]|jgi:DNA polymerase-3 subunit delta'
MSWQGIEGHDRIAEMFSRAFTRGRLEGSFLFTGPEGIGKRSFAFQLAKTILCLSPRGFAPCGECESCRLFDLRFVPIKEEVITSEKVAKARERAAQKVKEKKKKQAAAENDPFHVEIPNHPDFYYIAKPADRTQLPLELLIGPKEDRGTSGLCHDLFRTPFFGNRKVAVIDDADTLNEEGANALLKTLEEPPRGALMILIGTSPAKQLPTIRSRCQSVRFSPLSTRDLATVLVNNGMAIDFEEGVRLAKYGDGSCKTAILHKDDSLRKFRPELYMELVKGTPDFVKFSKSVNDFVESGTKDAQTRRRRLTIVLTYAARFYRDLLRFLSGDESVLVGNHDSGQALRQAAQKGSSSLTVAQNAERTIEALEQIDRMGNLSYIVESWISDLR